MDHFFRARELLSSYGLDAVLFQEESDLLYCTGLHLSHGTFLVTKDVSTLYLDGRYFEMGAKKKGAFDVALLEKPQDLFKQIPQGVKIGFNPSTMTVATYEKMIEHSISLTPASAYFSGLRRKKDPSEIALIERACALCEKGLDFLLEEVRLGVTEKQLSAALKSFWFQHGADDVSFEPIIAFGAHSSIPHWRSGDTALKRNSVILMDIGVALNDYQSDMTRVAFFGTPDEELLKCHAIVKEAHEKAFAFAAQGVTPHHLDSIAREYIAQNGYKEFFPHGLGHGLGLQVHEPPRLSPSLTNEEALHVGDVITIEPGIYLPGRGGIRLENTIVIEENGSRSLMERHLDPVML